jgi:hypothetical protein
MNNIFKILSVFIICVVLASCSKSTTEDTPIRDYAEQYKADLDSIDDYIDTHFMTVDPSNYDVTYNLIPDGGTQQSIREQTQYPLKDTLIAQNGIDYKVYFIKFREGDPDNGRRPTQVDSVYVSYKGVKLTEATDGGEDVFDKAQTPIWFKLQEVITGWAHMIPDFKTGTYTPGTGGNPATFENFGAGVMFLPSGLAYFNNGAGTIPSYSPIIFNFKLLELQYRDHDGDGILSKDERKLPLSIPTSLRWKENPYLGYDFNGDGTDEIYDTDEDGIPNMYDIDDDGDNYTTKSETLQYTNTITGKRHYYKFNGAVADDPLTPYDETQGVPDCSGDFVSPTRIRKY